MTAKITYDTNKLESAGDFSISEVTIFNPIGRVAGITSAVSEINIFEDLNSNFLTGNIVINDTVDLVNTLPILGQEYLEFKVRTPIKSAYDDDKKGGYDFTNTKVAVYKVTRNKLNLNTTQLVLDFISPEGIRDQNVRISRAFNGPYDDAVAKIFKKGWGLNSKKKLYSYPTKGNFKFVAPNMRPSDIINMVCSRAVPKFSTLPAYLFYENRQGFHFRSVDSFYFEAKATGVGSHPDMFEYFLNTAETKGTSAPLDNPLSQLRTVEQFKLKGYNDIIKAQRLGTYASKLITHDAYNKTYKEQKFNYIDEYNSLPHIEKDDGDAAYYRGLIYKAHYDFNDREPRETKKGDGQYRYLSDYADARLMVQSNTAKLHNINTEQGYQVNEYVQKRASALSLYDNLEIELTVPGNTHLSIGHIIRLNVPRSGPSKDETRSSQNDRYMSGRWLITAVRHNFNLATGYHRTVFTCTKETYGAITPETDKILQVTVQDEGNPINLYDNTEYV